MKLRRKFGIGFLIAGTMPALLVGAMLSSSYLKNAEIQHDESMQAYVHSVAAAVDSLIQNAARDMHGFAAAGLAQKDLPELSRRLAAYGYAYPYFGGIHWSSPDGTVLASSDPAQHGQTLARLYPEIADDLAEVMQAPAGVLHVSDLDDVSPALRAGIEAGRAGQDALMLEFMLRVEDESGRTAGVLVAAMSAHAIIALLRDIRQRPSLAIGETVLLNRRGEVLLSSDPRAVPFRLHPLAGRIMQESNSRHGQFVHFDSEFDGREWDVIVAETPGIGLTHDASWRLLSSHSDASFRKAVWDTLLWTMFILAAIVGAGGFVTLRLVRSITRPIETLAAAAMRIGAGDLTARAAVNKGDEVGEMAQAFNSMAETIERERNELVLTAVQLERHNQETDLRNELGDLLQSCISIHEAGAVIARFAPQLFEGASGAAYLATPGAGSLVAVSRWGGTAPAESLAMADCWALRRGRTHLVTDADVSLLCPHVNGPLAGASICVPLSAQGESLGLLHMTCPDACEPASTSMLEKQELAEVLAAQVGMALANLRLRETLHEQAIHDVLTGLYNRRYLEDALPRELSRARRAGQALAVFMLDVDHFKKFNDQHGHEAGDAVLKALGKALRDNCRHGDTACRFGGEEFTVSLTDIDLERAREWGERLMNRVRAMEVRSGDALLPRITISLGLALYPEHGEDAETLLQAADLALYDAKHAGRDRLAVFGANAPAGG